MKIELRSFPNANGFLLVTTTSVSIAVKAQIDSLDVKNKGKIYTQIWNSVDLVAIILLEENHQRMSKWTISENGFDSMEETIVNAPVGSEGTIKAERHWSLSADRKTLTVEATVQNPNGASTIKRVFVKK